jgi:hypothetical protein
MHWPGLQAKLLILSELDQCGEQRHCLPFP